MSGNSIGQNFVLTTFGESHGVAIGGAIGGAPAGIDLDIAAIQADLDRRKPGTSRHVTPRKESDSVQILSGIFEGKTTGTPIGFVIFNEDQRSQDYSAIAEKFRPGHADYSYWQKYGIRDYRGGGRSSARETASRVVGGAVAKAVLQHLCGTQIRAYVSQIGEHKLEFVDWAHVGSNPFNCPNTHQIEMLDRYLYDIRKDGDSIGAEITLVIEHVPLGLGEPVFDRLDADLAHALMSINAVKGVAVGDGFDGTRLFKQSCRRYLGRHLDRAKYRAARRLQTDQLHSRCRQNHRHSQSRHGSSNQRTTRPLRGAACLSDCGSDGGIGALRSFYPPTRTE